MNFTAGLYRLHITEMTKGLTVLSGLVFLWVLSQIFWIKPVVENDFPNVTPMSDFRFDRDAVTAGFAAYENTIGHSRFFGYIPPEVKRIPNASAGQTASDLIKDYRLKGIVVFDEPQAIVEDARTRKTMFVAQGESLNGLSVKAIRQDTLVLEYLDEDIVMRIE